MINETELALRSKSGDQRSFEKLVLHYQRNVYAYAFKRLGNKADAEDVMQDTFINAFVNIKNLEKPESFSV